MSTPTTPKANRGIRPRNFPLLATLLALTSSTALADSVVVFNEIMYHPAANEPALEWVELYNQNAVDIDLAGWRLTGGIDYTFGSGTIIRGGNYLVVAVSPPTLTAITAATNVVGPFDGRLSNGGEELRLRDNNNRLMDAMNFGVDGEWPVGADGGGVSLAKVHPNLASAPAENWTVSAQIGGTPGSVNFSSAPLLGPPDTLVPLVATWRYDDSGIDRGTAWRTPAYDDSGWAAGEGLFFFEDGPLPGPKSTPLRRDMNTYYFRGSFELESDPAAKIVSFRPVIDDGAIFYVNGVEVRRMNMPTGAVDFATMAAIAVSDAAFSGPFTIPSSNLVTGHNVLAVEVHQTTSTTNAGLRVLAAGGYTVSWDGQDGAFSTPASPALAPMNDALASLGVEAFASSNTNQAANVNDGRYGNSSSWSPAPGDASPYVVLRFNQTLPISSIAWSRDNGDTNEAGCPGGTCLDRALGNYTFQYTLHTNPAVIVSNNLNPTNGWTTISTIQYLSTQSGFAPHLRHRFDFVQTNGQPLLATGIRLRPSNTNTIDEIEVNPPVISTFDAVFGLELTRRDILPSPPTLAFNEISGANTTNFWLEVINRGDAPVDLAGVRIVRSGGSLTYIFPAQMLAPGGLAAVTQAQLGFGAALDDTLFLFTARQQALLDSLVVKTNSRGRFPDGVGDWMYPTQGSPGASNVVAVRRDLVINEIMYHAPPLDPVPAVTSNLTLAPITGAWRYNDTGADLGTSWRAPGFDDSVWPIGAGLLTFNTGTLPAPTGTTLAAGRTTYYFRTSFNFSGATSNVTLDVRAVVDDGAVFYLNGVEIHRQNMPAGPVTYATSALGPIADADFANTVIVPADSLAQGVNVLAVEVHQITPTTSSSGIVLTGGGLTLVEEGPMGNSAPMNLARRPGAAPFVIDSLSGFPIHNFVGLTDGVYGNNNSWIGNSGSPGYAGVRFGGQFTISSVAFGRDNTATFTDRTLGLYTLQYTRVASPDSATTVTQNPDTGWANIGTLNYQSAGTGLFANPSRRHRFTFTPVDATGIRLVVPGTGINAGTCIDELEVNPPDTTGDVAFGAEISLTTTLESALPYRESDEEWVELFNRSSNGIDLTGWRLDAGIDFRFTNGPVVPPGGFVVIARDGTALRAKWSEIAGKIVGDFSGRFQGGERLVLREANGNPVDETRIFEGGWSDGGGSSLELRDIDANHLSREAWADSDESAKAAWQTVTYRMVAGQRFGNVRWNELRIGLLDEGVVLLDDVSVLRDPNGTREQLIQNGNFETTAGNTHWRFLGHHRGEFVPDPDNSGNRVLKLFAGGRTVMNHNHAETTFLNNAPLQNGQPYEVSYRARWVAGSPQVSTRAYFGKLAKSTTLAVPTRLGTPGAPNSRRVDNAGPTFAGLQHAPVVPPTNQPVTISVRASDPDGVASATLSYRVNPTPNFTPTPMTLQTNGAWTAEIPGLPAGRIVQFYVTATDMLGASATAPAKGPDSRALYQVADSQGSTLPVHELRLIMLDADRDFMLNPTNVMSNARNGATLIYDRTEVFYDAGARLQGTAASRIRDGDPYVSYDVDFPPGRFFRGVQDNIGIDRSGRGPTVRGHDEIYVLHMFHHAGVPAPYSDLCYFISPRTIHTGTAILQLAGYGGRFVDEQYGDAGSVFNMDATYEPDTLVTPADPESPKLAVPLQTQLDTDFTDLGDQEQFRSPFDIRVGNRRDDYAGLMRLCRVMGSPQAEFDAQIAGVLNVDEALRMTALEILCGIQDTYVSPVSSFKHNLRLVTFVDGDPAELLPWDMDFVIGVTPTTSVLPFSGFNFGKLMNHPATRRLYLHHINDLCQTAFNTDYMNPWFTHYASLVGQNYSAASTYVNSRRTYALSQLPAQVPFAITSNGGNNFATDTNFVTVTGTGWLDVIGLDVNGIPYAVNWATVTNWSLVVPLGANANLLTIQATDRNGNPIANRIDTITVTNTTPAASLPVVINEWMADNVGPFGFADPADGLFQDWFELFNPNTSPVNLGGYHLTDDFGNTAKFTIPTNTIIAGRGFLLVWADEDGSQNSPTNADLHANFRLNNGGEMLALFAPDGLSPQHTVTFGPQFANVSQGLFPDGAVGTSHFMTNWTPRASNRLGSLSSPQITSFGLTAGTLQLTITATSGRSYQVEYKDQLDATVWQPLGTAVRAANGALVLSVEVGSQPQRFYRIRHQ
jgi:hypothetical protein